MFKVTVTGLAGLQAQFKSLSAELPKIVGGELETMAQEWVAGAKKDAPADQSSLRGAITYYKKTALNYEIVSQTFYAPFMEFGTKGKYLPIPGTESIAAQFKGYKGGDFMELLRNIVRWVHRKGITGTYSVKTRRRTGNKANQFAEDYSAAWPIAMSILKHGVKPHPYFFKQMGIVWPKMIQRIEMRLGQVTKAPLIRSGIGRPQIGPV